MIAHSPKETLVPLHLRLAGRFCIVVGAGAVGLRKCGNLLAAGANVRLIDPGAAKLKNCHPGLDLVARLYRRGDLRGAWLVVAATGNRNVNQAVAEEAGTEGALVNIVDDPEAGDIFWPAVFRRGDLTVSVSTGGGSPALASQVRDRVAELIGPEWAAVLQIAAALRQKRLTHPDKIKYDQEILRSFLAGRLPALVAEGNSAEIDRLLGTLVGEGTTLATLGVALPEEMT